MFSKYTKEERKEFKRFGKEFKEWFIEDLKDPLNAAIPRNELFDITLKSYMYTQLTFNIAETGITEEIYDQISKEIFKDDYNEGKEEIERVKKAAFDYQNEMMDKDIAKEMIQMIYDDFPYMWKTK